MIPSAEAGAPIRSSAPILMADDLATRPAGAKAATILLIKLLLQ